MRSGGRLKNRDHSSDHAAREPAEPAHAPIQRKAADVAVPGAARVDELTGTGADGTRATMERAFGTSFSGVEIKRDGAAEKMGAQAYAQGEQIHVASGRGDPSTREGLALLGHEYAHVVQQRQGRVATPQAKGGGGAVVADAALEAEADRAGEAVARGEPVSISAPAAAGAAQAKADGEPIQMFDGDEHKRMGDIGSGGKIYHWVTTTTAPLRAGNDPFKFALTHGDIVMLSGDLFDPRSPPMIGNKPAELDAGKGKVGDRDFFSYCSTASSAPGQHVGTQDEVIYAIWRENKNDARFLPQHTADGLGSIWHGITFSDDVKQRVEMRYNWLAYANHEHFADPRGPGSGGPQSGARASAGGSYRAMHEEAIRRAYDAKQNRTSLDHAMTYEAAAEHFLTDAFSSGHVRTARAGIEDFWGKKYPLFFDNFKHTIARDIAIAINRDETNAATLFGTVGAIEDEVLPAVEDKTRSLPPIGFDVVVNKLVHDTDNSAGVWVASKIHPEGWQTFGDGKAPSGSTTEARAAEAVQLGVADIQAAYSLPAGVAPDQLMTEVRARTQAPALAAEPLFGPEQALPSLDPAHAGNAAGDNGQLQWMQSDFQTLWNTQIRSGLQTPQAGKTTRFPTFGEAIRDSLNGGAMGRQIDGLASQIDVSKKVTKGGAYLGTVHPQAAFLREFVTPLKSNPRSKLDQIINFDPAHGITWVQTDNAVMDELGAMDRKDAAEGKKPHERERGLTTQQRGSWIRTLVHGTFNSVSREEAQRVVELFQTAPAAERPKIYKIVEGHDWKGHFQNGWWSGDDIRGGLNTAQRMRVEALINGAP